MVFGPSPADIAAAEAEADALEEELAAVEEPELPANRLTVCQWDV